MRSKRYLHLLLRLALGIVFVWAGMAKLIAPDRFFLALLGYDLPLPEALLRLTAVTLPWLECLCGGALLLNLWPDTVRPLTTGLCAVFVVLLTQAFLRGLRVDCGCFGGDHGSWYNAPLFAWTRAVVLLAAALGLLAIDPIRRARPGL